MDNQDKTIFGVLAAATGIGATAGTITVIVTTTKILGITVATTTVGLPVAGVIAAGGALTFGGYKMLKWLRQNDGGDHEGTAVPAPKEPPRSRPFTSK
jgi:hypothetical protein